MGFGQRECLLIGVSPRRKEDESADIGPYKNQARVIMNDVANDVEVVRCYDKHMSIDSGYCKTSSGGDKGLKTSRLDEVFRTVHD